MPPDVFATQARTEGDEVDLAGLAALLAIPAGLLTALGGLRERSLFARLERVEKTLTEGSAKGDEKKMLENARDHLIERIAVGELQPKLWSFYVTGGILLVASVAEFAWISLDPRLVGSDEVPALQVVGWMLYASGGAILLAAVAWRVIWQATTRKNQYRRRSA